jgi:GDPmannose 4,6-dehydratase
VSNKKTALITGVTGQDGSYLAELLLSLGYSVHGLVRRSSSFNTSRIDHLQTHRFPGELTLHHSDLLDSSSVSQIIAGVKPDEIYNLAAQSHVRVSFDVPIMTSEVTGIGALNVLESIRRFSPNSKMYQASSSEMFGETPPPQNERSPFYPKSPYGVSKVYSYWMAVNYREAYGLHISNGILFNHESPRRSPTFVTRKITRAAVEIASGSDSTVRLGNLESRRDWGYAPEYAIGMWMILQQDVPDNYVLGTGTSTSVREWAQMSFNSVGLNFFDHVEFDKKYLRPTEVNNLIADSTKAFNFLGWSATTKPEKLVELMVRYESQLQKDSSFIDSVQSELWDSVVEV